MQNQVYQAETTTDNLAATVNVEEDQEAGSREYLH